MNAKERSSLFEKEKKSIKEIIEIEQQKYMNFYDEVYKGYEANEKIAFNASSLLKGVIRFEYTEDANKSISSLVKKCKKIHSFIELENKLTS